MTSQKQIIANQKNAQRSTGPKTARGLQVVSQNALKHGIYTSGSHILPHEDREAYERLKQKLKDDFQATTQIELVFIEKMTQALWKKERLLQLEQQMIEAQQIEQEFARQKQEKNLKRHPSSIEAGQEIQFIKEELVNIKRILRECKRFNQMPAGKKRDTEAEYLRYELYETIQTIHERLLQFLDYSALSEAKNVYPKTPEGQYARQIILSNVTHSDYKDEPLSHPVSTYVLEKLQSVMKERLFSLEGIKKEHQQSIEMEAFLSSVGLDLLPDEVNQAKLERYQSYLDNQFYKALHELQKLQAFLLQKKNFQAP